MTVSSDGDVIYCNQYFAALVDAPLHHVIGAPIDQFVDVADQPSLKACSQRAREASHAPPSRGETRRRQYLGRHRGGGRQGTPHPDRHGSEHADQGAARKPVQG